MRFSDTPSDDCFLPVGHCYGDYESWTAYRAAQRATRRRELADAIRAGKGIKETWHDGRWQIWPAEVHGSMERSFLDDADAVARHLEAREHGFGFRLDIVDLTESPLLEIQLDDDPPIRCTLAEFIRGNIDCEDSVYGAKLVCGRYGDQNVTEWTGGGGAAPVYTLRRVVTSAGFLRRWGCDARVAVDGTLEIRPGGCDVDWWAGPDVICEHFLADVNALLRSSFAIGEGPDARGYHALLPHGTRRVIVACEGHS